MSGAGFKPARGITLLIPGTGPASDPEKGHLFVILTNTCPLGQNLLVPICTITTKHDTTCLLKPGEHRFIVAGSYVAYYFLQTYGAPYLISRVEKKLIFDKGPMDEAVVARICDGVEKSSFSPPRQKAYYRAQKSG